MIVNKRHGDIDCLILSGKDFAQTLKLKLSRYNLDLVRYISIPFFKETLCVKYIHIDFMCLK